MLRQGLRDRSQTPTMQLEVLVVGKHIRGRHNQGSTPFDSQRGGTSRDLIKLFELRFVDRLVAAPLRWQIETTHSQMGTFEKALGPFGSLQLNPFGKFVNVDL